MTVFRKRLALGVSLAALGAAAPYGASQWAATSIRSGLGDLAIQAADVAVSPLGVVTIEGLRRTSAGVDISIGRAEYRIALNGLFSPAHAQASGYTLEALAFDLGAVKIAIPKLVVEGASFSKDDIARIFAGDAGMPARIKTMSAKSVSIPEISVAVAVPNGDALEYKFRNVSLDNIVNGKIDRIITGSTTFASKMKEGSQKGEIFKTEVRGLDLVQSTRMYFETAPADEKLATVYESYSGDGMKTSVESAAAIELEMGKFSAGALRGRPLKTKSLSAVVAEFLAEAEKNKASGADKSGSASKKKADQEIALRLFTMANELIDSFEEDGMTGENIKFFVGEKAKPVATFGIAKVEGSYGGGKMASGFRITGVDVKAPDVTAKLAFFGVEGFSYRPMFQGMAEAMRAGDTEFKSIDPRKLIPKLGTTTLKGLEIDAPDPKAPKGIKPERIVVKLGNMVIGATDQINGIPTKINFVIDNLAAKLPENSADSAIKQLKALGYSALDMSARLTAAWNEKSKEIDISEVSVSGVNMGKARITGVIGNIGKEIFEADAAMAQVALMGATAKTLNLQLDNTGLAEKAFAFQARTQNRKPEDLRKEMGTMAALGIPAVLGPSDEAKAIAGAISKFITQPKSIKIDVKAKNAGGIGLPDIVTVGSPDKALGLVNVAASAD